MFEVGGDTLDATMSLLDHLLPVVLVFRVFTALNRRSGGQAQVSRGRAVHAF